MTAIKPGQEKLRDKMMEEKTLEMKKANEFIKQNTYEKKNKKNTKQEPLKRKTIDRRRTNTKNGKIRYRTKNENYRNPTMQISQQPELEPIT